MVRQQLEHRRSHKSLSKMRILCNILVVLFVTATAVGQQINPVPDYIFRNSMSVGRNAPTDTSAYFSIGPRFGATRGFMPPMVVDTAAVTGTKRNGLLIYSIQRNSFLYWDSTGSRWSRIAANLDTLLLSTRAWRQKGDDSLAAIINTRTDTVNRLSTKAWRQKGIDSVASLVGSGLTGTGINGYFPKWTGTKGLDTSVLFQRNGRLLYGRTTSYFAGYDTATVEIDGNGRQGLYTLLVSNSNTANTAYANIGFKLGQSGTADAIIGIGGSNASNSSFRNNLVVGTLSSYDIHVMIGSITRAIFNKDGETILGTTGDFGAYRLQVEGSQYTTGSSYWNITSGENYFGTTTDAGDYRVQIAGGLYNTTNAALAVSSGNVGIGTASPSEKLHIVGRARVTTIDSSASPINMLWADNNGVIRKTAVPTASVSGGTTDFIPLWSSSTALTSSVIKQVSSEILVDYASDQGAFKLQVNGAALADGGYRSGAPNGGTAATWKLGIVVAGSYTAASNYLQVDVGGTLYYIGLVTPN
jgi:hypothetical protein